MTRDDFYRESTAGGPGLDGYAYHADTYCVPCAHAIVSEIADAVAPQIEGLDDPVFQDSEMIPQPIFHGESESAQYCGDCGEYLYGGGGHIAAADDDEPGTEEW